MLDFFNNKLHVGDRVVLRSPISPELKLGKSYPIKEIDESLGLVLIEDDNHERIAVDPAFVICRLIDNRPNELFDKKPSNDPVESPQHYLHSNIETIDVIKAWLGPDKFTAYLNGNVIKYISRWEHKNGIEDLKKAKWYLEKMIEELE